ncbi:MAG: hypothetical protein WBP26_00200 [Candidatus Saccharimonadales bacterium]
MHKKTLALLITAAVIIASTAVYVLVNKDNPNSAVSSPPNNGTKAEDPNAKDGETVTRLGKVGCLVHKDTSGPVDAMCAIGLQTDDGTWYALGFDDPTATSVLADSRIRVTGTLTTPETRYTSLGTITVTSVEKL